MLELGLTLLGHAAYCMSLVVLWHKPYSQGVPQASIKHAEIFPMLSGALFKVKPQSFRWFCCNIEEPQHLSILHKLVI